MSKPIMNIDEVALRLWGHGGVAATVAGASEPPERFAAQLGAIGSAVGARKLGYGLVVVQPGKRGWPLHNHHANEEMFFIIEGSGEVRIGAARHAIRKGDVIACPPGGPETAHQIVNTSDAPLTYLAVSTKIVPEVTDYPDSGKFGVLTETPGGAGGTVSRFIGRMGEGAGYWEGE